MLVGASAIIAAATVERAAAQPAPALFFDTHKTRLPARDCMQDAHRTVKAVGLHVVSQNAFSILANTPKVTAFIVCTTLPKAGPCAGQDGAVVTMIVTAQPGPDAPDMLKRISSTFGNAQLIDCG